MLESALSVLYISGMVLLILLCVIVVLLLLLLFFPVSYRVEGKKTPTDFTVSVRGRWLLGLLRGEYCYPQPAKMKVKLLFFSVFDASKPRGKKKAEQIIKKDNAEGGTAKDSTVKSTKTADDDSAKDSVSEKSEGEIL